MSTEKVETLSHASKSWRIPLVHFNNAGCSPMPEEVLETVIRHLRLESELGGYLAAECEADKIDSVYSSIQQLIGCDDPREIALVESATVAWTRVFYAICDTYLGSGSVILFSQLEYAANVVAIEKIAREKEYTTAMMKSVTKFGIVDVDALRDHLIEMISSKKIPCILVCVTHIGTNCGLINPVNEIGDMIQAVMKSLEEKIRIFYLVDGCQSVGQIKVNVRDMKCHALSCTGRKYLRGPRGTGFLYVQKSLANTLSPSHIDHSAAPVLSVPFPGEASVRINFKEGARRFEFWESSIANRLGLGKAIEVLLEAGIENIESQCKMLGTIMRKRLSNYPNVYIHHYDSLYESYDQCGIVAFKVKNENSETLKQKFAQNGFTSSVVPSTSTPYDSSITCCRGDLLRVSLSSFNTVGEVESFFDSLSSLITFNCSVR